MQRENEDLALHRFVQGHVVQTSLPEPGRAPRNVQAECLEALGHVAYIGLEASLGGRLRGLALDPFLFLSVHVDLQGSLSERDPHVQPGLAMRRRGLPVELH